MKEQIKHSLVIFRKNFISILRFQTVILFLLSLALFSIIYLKFFGYIIAFFLLGYCSLLSLQFYSQGEKIREIFVINDKRIVLQYFIFLSFAFILLSPIFYISFPKLIKIELFLEGKEKYLIYLILGISLFVILSAISFIPAKIIEKKSLREAFIEGLHPKFFEKGMIYNIVTFSSLLLLTVIRYEISLPLFFLFISPILNIFYWEIYRM